MPRKPEMDDTKTEENNTTTKKASGGISRKPKNEISVPCLELHEKVILGIGYLFLFLVIFYLIEQFCSIHPLSWLIEFLSKSFPFLEKIFRPCIWGTYLAFGVVLIMVVLDRVLRHVISVQRARLVDQSAVLATFVEADTVEVRLTNPEKPENFQTKKSDLANEVSRLKSVGKRGWTEYQVLSLNQMLVDFLKIDDLIASARLNLAELEEYAEDGACRYEWEQYYRWENRIEEAIKTIEETKKDTEDNSQKNQVNISIDDSAEILRAELRTLLEHIAGYQMNWAEGSTIIRNIMICGVITIPVLLSMGLLPLIHPVNNNVDKILGIFNWGLLGISGAITAVLLNLRKSNLVEVGNTEGKKELWRAVLSTALGLVAGILGHSIIAGGFLSTGGIIPEIGSGSSTSIGLSILWAVASGFYFEKVFDRMLSSTVGGS